MPKLTQKGQVTIPIAVREALGVRPGDEVVFRVTDNQQVVVSKCLSRSPFGKYIGYLSHKAGQDPDRIVSELRGEVV